MPEADDGARFSDGMDGTIQQRPDLLAEAQRHAAEKFLRDHNDLIPDAVSEALAHGGDNSLADSLRDLAGDVDRLKNAAISGATLAVLEESGKIDFAEANGSATVHVRAIARKYASEYFEDELCKQKVHKLLSENPWVLPRAIDAALECGKNSSLRHSLEKVKGDLRPLIEDAIANARLEVLNQRRRIDFTRQNGQLAKYVETIARNHAIRYFKQELRQGLLNVEPAAVGSASAGDIDAELHDNHDTVTDDLFAQQVDKSSYREGDDPSLARAGASASTFAAVAVSELTNCLPEAQRVVRLAFFFEPDKVHTSIPAWLKKTVRSVLRWKVDESSVSNPNALEVELDGLLTSPGRDPSEDLSRAMYLRFCQRAKIFRRRRGKRVTVHELHQLDCDSTGAVDVA